MIMPAKHVEFPISDLPSIYIHVGSGGGMCVVGPTHVHMPSILPLMPESLRLAQACRCTYKDEALVVIQGQIP